MSSRTREKLIDSAKLLFMRKGVENTTISDIANASDKGRRTIYTYFKNKKEIYNAVIERESDRIAGQLRGVAELDMPASEKLRRFVVQRMQQSKITSSPYVAIKSLISMDFGRSGKIRRLAWEKEADMLGRILEQGVADGEFDADSVHLLRKCLYRFLQSIDLVATDEEFMNADDFGSSLIELLIRAIKRDKVEKC